MNVARWCGIDPEEGLAGTNQRFLDRFSRVEAALEGDLQGAASRIGPSGNRPKRRSERNTALSGSVQSSREGDCAVDA